LLGVTCIDSAWIRTVRIAEALLGPHPVKRSLRGGRSLIGLVSLRLAAPRKLRLGAGPHAQARTASPRSTSAVALVVAGASCLARCAAAAAVRAAAESDSALRERATGLSVQ